MADHTLRCLTCHRLRASRLSRFDGGRLSTDGGLLVLREIEQRLKVADRLAACIDDSRDPSGIVHTLANIIRFRLLMIAAGYEDGNDATSLRADPLFKLALERAAWGRDLCSQSTNGGAGNDTIYATDATYSYGGDTIYAGTGNDTIYGQGNDEVTGEVSPSVTVNPVGSKPSIGIDTVYGNGGNDTINGVSGADTLYGGDGNDTVEHRTWWDNYIDGDVTFNGTASFYGGTGNDTLGSQFDGRGLNFDHMTYRMYGEAGDDILSATYYYPGSESTNYGAATDYLYGGAGNDTIPPMKAPTSSARRRRGL